MDHSKFDVWDDPNFDEDDVWGFDDEGFQDSEDDDEDLSWATEYDYCCWDPNYTGLPGTCRCKEEDEENEAEELRRSKWWNRLYDRMYFAWDSMKRRLRNAGILPEPAYWVTCDECGHKFDYNKQNVCDCPKCGNSVLPF